MKLFRRTLILFWAAAALRVLPAASAQTSPTISLVANAEGENPVVAANTWVEIKGSNLSKPGDSRTWQSSDFINGQLPTALDGVSVTVGGKNAYVYYISPGQIDILTPPNTSTGSIGVQVVNNGAMSPVFTVDAQALSPSFFNVSGGPYVLAQHGADYSLVGPTSLSAPGYPFTPAKPGEIVILYANGFGTTSTPVVAGSETQGGTLSPLPVVQIGGIAAQVQGAALISPGLFQFNVVIPPNAPSGDNAITVTYNGASVLPVSLITIQGSGAAPTSVTLYVAPNGNDFWSGRLATPNSTNTDGPFGTFDRARTIVQEINKAGLSQINVQFRAGTYFLPATEMLTAADSGSATTEIVYQNYPGDSSPVISGGVRLQNWTNTGGNSWKATLPASTRYFENLFYNGVRRLRPRLGSSSGNTLGTYYRIDSPVYLNAPAPPASAPNSNCDNYVTGSGWECYDRFQYNATDPIASTWRNLAPAAGNQCGQAPGNAAQAGDIEFVDFEKFSASKLRISCVDATNHIVYFTGRTAVVSAANAPAHGFIPDHRYLVENVEDDLAQPGQWFLDRSATPWTLTYLANPGENPNNDTVIIPQLAQVLVASNLQSVTLQGLTFAHDNYTIPAQGFADPSTQIASAVSFQNAQEITFNSGIMTQISGVGLEFISCIDSSSPAWCVSRNASGATSNNLIENSAFYDVGSTALRIGMPAVATDTEANVPQFTTVENNVVEGYGRILPSAKGILQGNGHDNTYIHNDVYDGYHGAIAVCNCSGVPELTNNITISFNHVYNLMQGIMNDGGSLYFETASAALGQPTGTGNKMLNNKVHDVNDASVQDTDGYGGDGLYIDDFTGAIDAENNLVYRVSGNALSFSGPRAGPNEASTIKNNIFAYARQSLINAYDPYSYNTAPPTVEFGTITNNLFYFDRNSASSPPFYAQGGCTYTGGIAYTAFEQWSRSCGAKCPWASRLRSPAGVSSWQRIHFQRRDRE